MTNAYRLNNLESGSKIKKRTENMARTASRYKEVDPIFLRTFID
jgi:hypothetical protein